MQREYHSAQMAERTIDPKNTQFTTEDIARVKTAIRENPALGRQLIDSAQNGSQEDLRFLIWTGFSIFSDNPGEPEIFKIQEED